MFEVSIKTSKGTYVDKFIVSNPKTVVGKDKGCDIPLKGWKIGGEHACLYDQTDGVYILDLKNSSTGVIVNGKKVDRFGPLSESDTVSIDAYILSVVKRDAVAGDQKAETSDEDKGGEVASSAVAEDAPANGEDLTVTHDVAFKTSKADQEKMEISKMWRGKLHEGLLTQLDLRRINIKDMGDEEVYEMTSSLLHKCANEFVDFPHSLDKNEIVKQVLDESIGLGPLEDMIADDDISEIMVNNADEIFFEKNGELFKSDVTFTNDRAVQYAIERIVTPLGRRIDESSPMVDARLKDGSRVNAVIPPLALKGSSITIRKFMKEKLTSEHLINFSSLDRSMVDFIELAVTNKQNIVISGGTGSGKTTLLNVCSNYIPDDERIVTVEDAAELKLYQPNLVALEARPPNQEGKGAVHIRDLVKNCLRMRPDRIIVGECRGGEALDMLQAMNTGHDGSLTTAHANSPRDCISRVEVMVMMAGMDLPIQAIREQLASAVDIIVQQTRFSCGTRKVTSICEVSGIENGVVQLGEIFKFVQTGRDAKGKVVGEFTATGVVPRICEELRSSGLPVDMSIFNKQEGILQ